MATEIDKKIVELELRNQQFEKASAKSVSTLDRLKGALSFKNTTRGMTSFFSSFNRGLSNVNFSPITSGVQTVTASFSAMQVAGATAISKLTSSVMGFASKQLNTFVIEPRKTGFQEYETKIGAIQTMLTNTASKGTTLEDVNKTLNELNRYADLTIYNFAEMTKNIGTFTAAGVGLEDAATAIKGIANLGAGSGSTPAQVANAMYQMSQALNQPYMMLMDYNSLINAGMGGEKFKKKVIEIAQAMGTLAPGAKEAERIMTDFRNSLSDEQWLTKDVLLSAFQDFANDPALVAAATELKTLTAVMGALAETAQSGWAQTWELLVGDFDQAKKLFTNINDVMGGIINSSSDARNELVKGFVDLGGRDKVINAIGKAFNNLISVMSTIKGAWSEVFPPKTAKDLIKISDAFASFIDKLTPSTLVLNHTSSIFKKLFGLLKFGTKIFGAIGDAWKRVFPSKGNEQGLIKVMQAFEDLLDAITPSEEVLPIITDTFVEIFSVFEWGIDLVKSLGTGFVELFKGINTSDNSFLLFISDTFKNIFDVISNAGSKVNGASALSGAMGKIDTMFNNLGNTLMNYDYAGALNNAVDSMKKFWEGIQKFILAIDEDTMDALAFGGAAGGLGLLINGIRKIFKKEDNISTVASGMKSALEGLGKVFKAWQSELKSRSLLNIAKAVGILTASLFVLSMLDYKAMWQGIAAVGALIGMLTLAVKAMGGMTSSLSTFKQVGSTLAGSTTKGASFMSIAVGLLALATAVGILAVAATLMSIVDVRKGMLGVIGLISIITVMAVVLSKMKGSILSTSAGIFGIAASMTLLVAPLLFLSMMPYDKMYQGFAYFSLLLVQIGLFVLAMQGLKLANVGLGMMGLAIGMGMLSSVVVTIGLLAIPMATGLLVMIPLILVLAGAIKLLSNSMKGVGAIIGVAFALNLMATALLQVGLLINTKDLSSMVFGLAALMGLIGVLVLASGTLNTKAVGVMSLIGLAVALNMLVAPMIILGQLPLKKMSVALLGLVGSIAVLAVAAVAINKSIPGVMGLIGLAFALSIIALPIRIIGAMDSKKMFQAVLAIGALVAIMTLATKFMGLEIKGVAMMLLVATALVGISAALVMVAAVDTGGLWKVILAIAALVAAFLLAGAVAGIPIVTAGLLALSGALLALGGAGALFGLGAKLIGDGFKMIAIYGDVAFDNMAEGAKKLAKVLPDVASDVVDAVEVIVDGVIELSPKAGEAMGEMLASMIGAIPLAVPKFIENMHNAIRQTIDSIESDPTFGEDLLRALNSMFEYARDNGQQISDTLFGCASIWLKGLAEGVEKYGPEMLGSIDALGNFMAEALFRTMFDPAKMVNAFNRSAERLMESLKFWENGEAVELDLKVNAPNTDELETKIGQSATDALLSAYSGMMNSGASSPAITPVINMDQPNLVMGQWTDALSKTFEETAKMEGTIFKQENLNVTVNGGSPIQVQGTGGYSGFSQAIGTANIEQMLANELKKGLRR